MSTNTYYMQHREKALARSSKYRQEHYEEQLLLQKNYRQQYKAKVIGHYSNETNRCNRCGFNDMRALQIDHIKGGGHKHLEKMGLISGSPFYLWLIRNNFPSGFQVLCANCQWIKRAENNENRKSLKK